MTTTDAWRPALDMLHTGRGDPLSFVANALRADPHWVAGHCLRAALLVMACREDADEQLEQTLNAAQALDAHADERERRHLAAAHAWLSRDLKGALRQYGAIAADHPHDTLALKVVHFGEFAWGSMDRLRKRTAAALGHWREGMHGYDHVLAMHAFALVESSDIAQAEQVARRALAIDAGNAAAIHALAHVIEMQGRSTEGIGWLRSCEADWVDNPAYAVHLWWHLALFHLDRGDIAAVLRIHDEHLTVHADAPASTLVDASALLWRLHLRGVDSIDRLQSLADAWERQPLGVLRPFSDTHAMLAYVAAGRRDSCLRLIAALRRNAAGARDLDPVIQVAALPVCEALMAFGAGRYAEACDRLHALRELTIRCGGSKAQCDLLHLTWLEAALRGGHGPLARSLASERMAKRPRSAFNLQLRQRVLSDLSDDAPGDLGTGRAEIVSITGSRRDGDGIGARCNP